MMPSTPTMRPKRRFSKIPLALGYQKRTERPIPVVILEPPG
jgi:hypothetical protein